MAAGCSRRTALAKHCRRRLRSHSKPLEAVVVRGLRPGQAGIENMSDEGLRRLEVISISVAACLSDPVPLPRFALRAPHAFCFCVCLALPSVLCSVFCILFILFFIYAWLCPLPREFSALSSLLSNLLG